MGRKCKLGKRGWWRVFDQWGCFGIELVIRDNNHGHRDPFSIKVWRKCERGVGGVGECEGEGGGEVELAGRGAVCSAASGAEEDSRFSWRNVIGGAGTA